jgi:hypothetical protein
MIHTCTIQRRYSKQKFPYTGSTGSPTVGATLTGATTHKTAVVDQLFTGYLVVRDLTGSFSPGEIISITSPAFSATLGAAVVFANTFNEAEYYWLDDQVSVPCRFYNKGGGARTTDSGQHVFALPKVKLDGSVTILEKSYRIVSTIPGAAGTFSIERVKPLWEFGEVPAHYECDIKAVT